MNVLVITDNDRIFRSCKDIFNTKGVKFSFFTSPDSIDEIPSLNLKDETTLSNIVRDFNLIISLHCKQIFPEKLVNSIRCVNCHPGYLPYNRGMFPHIWSIVNGLPTGVTIHEMVKEVDAGPILFQKEINIKPQDTSLDVYNRIIEAEKILLSRNIDSIVSGELSGEALSLGGNYNSKEDYEKLKHIDLDKNGTFEEFINILRATTHDGYKNAYYIKDDKKIFIEIKLSQ